MDVTELNQSYLHEPCPRRKPQYRVADLLVDNANVRAEDIVAFLRQLKAQLGGPFTVLWDGNVIHSRSRLVRQWLVRHPEVVVEDLPTYAPDLNPDEAVWGWTKYGRLVNLAAAYTDTLRDRVIEELTTLQDSPKLLRSFIAQTDLPLAA